MAGRGHGIDIDDIAGYGVKQERHDCGFKKDFAIAFI
jgi:hypothetical protein